MQGLTLSRMFYHDLVEPILQNILGTNFQRLAIGLVGEGSECFGFDDNYSQDHDFGAGLCIWVKHDEYLSLMPEIEKAFSLLPPTFLDFNVRIDPDSVRMPKADQRVGLFSIEGFYQRFINKTHLPKTWQEWYMIPEHFLATCTNGDVFYDGPGEFTSLRNALLDFFPEDVRKKKITARLGTMAQSGQYNLLRLLKRKDGVGASLACLRFTENALACYFLLHKKYMPFYKWAFKSLEKLPQGKDFAELLNNLLALNLIEYTQKNKNEQDFALVQDAIEKICLFIISLLEEQGLTTLKESWLMAQAQHIQANIDETQIRNLPLMHGIQYS